MSKKEEMKSYSVFTDGSFRRPCYGAWACLIRDDKTKDEFTVSKPVWDTTISRMELEAVISALEWIPEPSLIKVESDSTYVVNSMSKWIFMWARFNWENAFGEKIKNVDLMKRLYTQLKKHKVKARWVRSHNGHRENEICDAIVNKLTLDMQNGTIKRPT